MLPKTLVSLFSIALLAAMVVAPAVEAQQDDDRRGDRDRQGRRGGGPGGRQFGRGGGGFGFAGDAKLGLLRVDAVREEIKVNEVQQDLVNILNDELREARPDFPENYRDLSEEEQEAARESFRKAMEEQSAQARETLKTILEESQYKRLFEIMVQTSGYRALYDAEVAQALKVTEEQTQKLRETEQQIREEMFAQFRDGGGFGRRGDGEAVDRDALRERFEAARKEQEEKMLANLSEEQRTAFAAMKGEAFEMPERQFGFGGGRGGPGGRNRGDGGGRGGDRPERPDRPE